MCPIGAASAEIVGQGQGYHSDRELRELREEMLGPLGIAVLLLAVGMLLAAGAEGADRVRIWMLVLPMLATAGLTRIRRPDALIGSALTVGGLGGSVAIASALYPDRRIEYALCLVVFAASVLVGARFSIATAILASAWVVASAQVTAGEGLDVVEPVLVVIWSAAALSGLASRPTRTALEWAWRSYSLALERAEELRRQRGELGRLAKSLRETCERLEEMNWELERARRVAEEAKRQKAEFAATLSHELRTPLNLVIGFTEMMMTSPQAYGQDLPEPYRQDLEAVYRNACQVSSLASDVLDLSQIEAHRMALERSATSVKQIVDDAVATLAPHYGRLGLRLDAEVGADLPVLYVDGNRIRQVLINLLNNAARFTSRGGVTVRAMRDDENVVLSVADTGDGISPEALPHVFEDFHQAGPGDRRQGGSGLGLAVSKRFVDMHGGYIRVESQLGAGSTFYVALPLCDNVVSSPFSLASAPRPVAERTIAVLDSEPEAARVFRRYLDGYQVVQASGNAELRRLVAERPLQAIVRTRAGDPAPPTDRAPLRDLPVFTCPINTPRALAERLGVAAYLVKPVSGERLIAAVNRWGKRGSKGPRDVLVVDDDAGLRRLVASTLSAPSRRLRVRTAGDGGSALAQLRERPADLVLLDLQIPGLSGYEVLEAMKSDPALSEVPVVIITGKAAPEEAVVASGIALSRAGGLTVGEMMKCLRGSLDALLDSP